MPEDLEAPKRHEWHTRGVSYEMWHVYQRSTATKTSLQLNHLSREMPDVTVINDFNEDIHVAFFLGVPTNWKNHLKPGERWTCHLASLPLHFEARWVQRVDFDTGNVWRSREFSHDDSMEMLATIGGACAAGTASVLSAGAFFASDMVAGIPIVSGPLMAVASAGGATYGTWGADGRLCMARVWVPFWNKQYSIRMVDGRGCVLWDVDDNRPV